MLAADPSLTATSGQLMSAGVPVGFPPADRNTTQGRCAQSSGGRFGGPSGVGRRCTVAGFNWHSLAETWLNDVLGARR